MPKKQPLVVDDPTGAFKKFEDLARRLIAVPREELQEKLRKYQTKKNRRKALSKNVAPQSDTIVSRQTTRG